MIKRKITKFIQNHFYFIEMVWIILFSSFFSILSSFIVQLVLAYLIVSYIECIYLLPFFIKTFYKYLDVGFVDHHEFMDYYYMPYTLIADIHNGIGIKKNELLPSFLLFIGPHNKQFGKLSISTLLLVFV